MPDHRSRPALPRRLPASLALLLFLAPSLVARDDAPEKARHPDLTEPVLCLSVRGFREFVPREVPELTRDEKLQIYYEPFNFTIVRRAGGEGPTYRAHLTQDVRIRRAGNARVLKEERRIIDYAPDADDPPTSFYMFTTLELKQYPLGSYEVDLVLRDELAEGRPETVQTVPFRVVAPPADSP